MLRSANAGLGLFILRVVVGLVFLWHGLGKLVGPPLAGGGMDGTIGFFTQVGIPLPDVAAWGVALVETLGGLALILGIVVPLAALLLAIDMAVAILKVRLAGGFAAPNGFEYELTLLAALMCLFFAGPGIVAVQIRPRQG
jgi:putative oxidoreductase